MCHWHIYSTWNVVITCIIIVDDYRLIDRFINHYCNRISLIIHNKLLYNALIDCVSPNCPLVAFWTKLGKVQNLNAVVFNWSSYINWRICNVLAKPLLIKWYLPNCMIFRNNWFSSLLIRERVLKDQNINPENNLISATSFVNGEDYPSTGSWRAMLLMCLRMYSLYLVHIFSPSSH